jgi:hypothetical protein
VLEPLRMYGRYLGISIRGQMQYRGAFVLSSLGQAVIITAELVGVWALFARFGALPGWSFPQVAFFYGFANGAFAIADALTTGFDRFGATHVKSGDFDRLLVRPRSTVLQLAGQDFALKRIGGRTWSASTAPRATPPRRSARPAAPACSGAPGLTVRRSPSAWGSWMATRASAPSTTPSLMIAPPGTSSPTPCRAIPARSQAPLPARPLPDLRFASRLLDSGAPCPGRLRRPCAPDSCRVRQRVPVA